MARGDSRAGVMRKSCTMPRLFCSHKLGLCPALNVGLNTLFDALKAKHLNMCCHIFMCGDTYGKYNIINAGKRACTNEAILRSEVV